jgi:8-oxo-dGTP diphosphatase
VKEETNLTVSHLEQFRMYSDPARDKRRHTASMVFRCIVRSLSGLHTGDDAKGVQVLNNILNPPSLY